MSSPIYVATLTGLVDLNDPDPDLIRPNAIAYQLARINRWGGATMLPVTVAQHSVVVLDIFRKRNPGFAHLGIYALLHDAPEYLIGDIKDPTARALGEASAAALEALAELRFRLDGAIAYALGIPPLTQAHSSLAAAIHAADMQSRAIEWSLLPKANGPSPYGAPPTGLPRTLKALAWPQAEELFLATLYRELEARSWERAA